MQLFDSVELVSPRRGQQPTQREQEDRDEDDGGGDESDGEEGVSAEELVQKYMERVSVSA